MLLILFAGRSLAATADDYYRAGLLLYQRGQYAQSVDYFKSALKLDPAHWKSCQALGQAYYLTGDPRAALQTFDRCLKLHPDNDPLRQWMEKLKAMMGRDPSQKISPDLGVVQGVKDPTALSKPLGTRPILEKRRGFARVTSGVFSGFFGDLNEGVIVPMDDKKKETGYFVRSEFGYSWDAEQAAGISAELVKAGRFQWKNSSYSMTLLPELFSASLLFYNLWPDQDGRWYVQMGLGYYQASVSYAFEPTTGAPTQVGNMGAVMVGGACSIGREVLVFNSVGFDFTAGFRYATFEQVIGDYQGGSGKVTLATDGGRILRLIDADFVSNGTYRAAGVDFSGFDLGVAVEFNFQ